MKKHLIKNREGKKVAVVVERLASQKGLAFVMHGLGGFKEQPQIQTFSDALKDNGYTVVTFDTTNTLGESEGSYEEATTTNYLHDLEDVIVWGSKQDFYSEPFVLIGHSLGGMSVTLYAENHSDKVRALAPISTAVSGELSLQTPRHIEDAEEWKRTGWLVKESKSKAGVIKRLPWSHMEDRLKHDLLPNADKLTMPVLLVVGEHDDTTPLKHQQILFDALKTKKELHVIKGAGHTFREQEHLDELYEIISSWLQKF